MTDSTNLIYNFNIASNAKFEAENEVNLIRYQPFHDYELERSKLLAELHAKYERKIKELLYADFAPKNAFNQFLHEQLSNSSRLEPTIDENEYDQLIPNPQNVSKLTTLIHKIKGGYPLCSNPLRLSKELSVSKFLEKIKPFIQIAENFNQNSKLNQRLKLFKEKIYDKDYKINEATRDEFDELFNDFCAHFEIDIDKRLSLLLDYLESCIKRISLDLSEISKKIHLDYINKKKIKSLNEISIHKDLDNKKVQVFYKRQCFEISLNSFWKLKNLYKIHNKDAYDECEFKSRLFSLVCRYESYFKNTSSSNEGYGLQAAIPGHVFNELNKLFDVTEEMFASPFNCYFSKYCSAFVDTDVFFGSNGSFFDYEPCEGSFECNPPFTSDLYLRMIEHIEKLLSNSNRPLSFVIFIPEKIKGDNLNADKIKESKYLRETVIVLYRDHQYVSGAQHLPTKSNNLLYDPCHNTQIFFLQNNAGYEKWKPTSEKIDLLQKAMAFRVENKINYSNKFDSRKSNFKRTYDKNFQNYDSKTDYSTNVKYQKRERNIICYRDLDKVEDY